MAKQGFWDRVLHGGPQHQARKKHERELQRRAAKEAQPAIDAAYIEAYKQKKIGEAKSKAMRKGGLGGALEKIGNVAKNLEIAGQAIGGDIDLSRMGQTQDFDFGLQRKKRKTRK